MVGDRADALPKSEAETIRRGSGRRPSQRVVEAGVPAAKGRAKAPSGARRTDDAVSLHPQLLQMAALFDCVDDVVVWIKDRVGRYCWVNRAFLINYSLDDRRDRAGPDLRDVIGKTDYDLSPAFLADQFRLDDEYVL